MILHLCSLLHVPAVPTSASSLPHAFASNVTSPSPRQPARAVPKNLRYPQSSIRRRVNSSLANRHEKHSHHPSKLISAHAQISWYFKNRSLIEPHPLSQPTQNAVAVKITTYPELNQPHKELGQRTPNNPPKPPLLPSKSSRDQHPLTHSLTYSLTQSTNPTIPQNKQATAREEQHQPVPLPPPRAHVRSTTPKKL